MEYLKWTYFYKRLMQNPSFYHLEKPEGANTLTSEHVDCYLAELVDATLEDLDAVTLLSVHSRDIELEFLFVFESGGTGGGLWTNESVSEEPTDTVLESLDCDESDLLETYRNTTKAGAVTLDGDSEAVAAATLGHIASYYYLDYRTPRDADAQLDALEEQLCAAEGDAAQSEKLAAESQRAPRD